MLEDAVLAGLVRPTDFEEIFDRLAGTRVKGLAKLRPMVEERLPAASPVDASYLERLLQRLLAREEVPAHLREHPFELNGQRVRVDAFIPEWDIVVEADGRRWHTRNEDFESDRRRDNELLRRGVRVIRFTYAMLKDDFEGCLDTLVEAGTVARASRRE